MSPYHYINYNFAENVQNCPLETHIIDAWVEVDGTLTVRSSRQGYFSLRRDLSQFFDIPLSKIRVIGPYLGGACGSKLAIYPELLVAWVAMKIGKPVLTTSYSGHSEFSDPRLQTKIKGLWPLDYNMYPYNDSPFAEPDIDHLKKLMNQVYREREKENELAEEHAKTMSKFTWENTGKQLNEFLKN